MFVDRILLDRRAKVRSQKHVRSWNAQILEMVKNIWRRLPYYLKLPYIIMHYHLITYSNDMYTPIILISVLKSYMDGI